MKILLIPPSLLPVPTYNTVETKILRIPSSLPPMPMHNTMEVKILRIPASLPKAGTVSITIKELDPSLRLLQISTSLRKLDDISTSRVSNPLSRLKVLQIPKC
ncbi:hypothetical protein AMTR_s00100p00019790 [Amborella trichopoda]|uniref:Uncharacterized protein n=1 Tax=Amborella trichopoda TaxID=13333 RepID=W1NT34_AMBTC|nr:hypothetical protein AMTR_s00100p00019790 [Amborella trichopoda]